LQRDLEFLVFFFKKFREENFQKIYQTQNFFHQFEMVTFNLINILKANNLMHEVSNLSAPFSYKE
jgi:hypothetical protein